MDHAVYQFQGDGSMKVKDWQGWRECSGLKHTFLEAEFHERSCELSYVVKVNVSRNAALCSNLQTIQSCKISPWFSIFMQSIWINQYVDVALQSRLTLH